MEIDKVGIGRTRAQVALYATVLNDQLVTGWQVDRLCRHGARRKSTMDLLALPRNTVRNKNSSRPKLFRGGVTGVLT